MDDAVWDVRIHFDAQHNLDRKICSLDVTFLNLYALMHTQGYSFFDELYHMKNLGRGEEREHGLELIDTNIKLQQLKKEYEHSLVLNLLVRATTPFVCQIEQEDLLRSNYSNFCQRREENLATILYRPPVVYDLSEPAVLAVDQQGVVFHSQCTQESRNFSKGKLKAVMEEDAVVEEGHNNSDDSEVVAYDSDTNPFCMEKYRIIEDTEIIEGNKLAEQEVEDEDSDEDDDDEDSEEEPLHYEGDTEVEDLFEMEEEEEEQEKEDEVKVVATEEAPMQKPAKKRKKLAVRRGPTTRTHSSVLEEVQPDFIPSSDEEDDGFLFEDEDDGHEPLSFVLPKGRKSRAKKRKPRIWYNDKLEQPHQQLCMYMCFTNQQQFRDALLSLHITQARDFRYHRNSDQRIIACCKQEHCQFCIVAAVIKGEKTFAIKKIRLEHTCPRSTETSRISAKWLAKTYESLFRSDPTTSIHTLIDNCNEKYGVDVPRHMAYRAKNLVVEAVLGEHKKQYPRLRDYAQTIMDTNPGSRVVVTTVTPKPTTKIPHPGPRFHAMFFCINGAREGFLNGCRPFIG